jgi:hypothetical protein
MVCLAQLIVLQIGAPINPTSDELFWGPYACLCILKFEYPMHATLPAARSFLCWSDAYL